MADINEKIGARLTIELTSAQIEAVINQCAEAGIMLHCLAPTDELTASMKIDEQYMKKFDSICVKNGSEYRIIRQSAKKRGINFAKRRKVLIAAIIIALVLSALSQLFVWQVELNLDGELPEYEILNILEDGGLYEGAFRLHADPEALKSLVMAAFPQVSWLGIKISGSRAIITVCGETDVPEINTAPADIAAKRSGIIKYCGVLQGQQLKFPGETAQEGELLVSGELKSLSNPTVYVRAKAKIIAETLRQQESACPEKAIVKGAVRGRKIRYAVKFGKKRCNLYFRYGKHIDVCDKIIKEYKLGIKGLFALPVTIVQEQLIFRERAEGKWDISADMGENLLLMLKADTDGEILSHKLTEADSDGLIRLTLTARCLENIARTEERASD